MSNTHPLLYLMLNSEPPVSGRARKHAEKLVAYLKEVVGYGATYEEYYEAMDKYVEKMHQHTYHTYEGGCTCPACIGRDYVESLLMWYDLSVVENEIERNRRLGRW